MPYEDKIMVASGDSEHPGEEEVGFETIPRRGGEGHVYDLEFNQTLDEVTLTEDGDDKTTLPLAATFVGTEAEWNALSAAEKANYRLVNFTEDGGIGDASNAVVAFTSSDVADGSATAWTSVTPITSGLSLRTLWERASMMFKNVRYLFKMLGTTDISSIGNGTVTGAISTINSDLREYDLTTDNNFNFNGKLCVSGKCALLYLINPKTAMTSGVNYNAGPLPTSVEDVVDFGIVANSRTYKLTITNDVVTIVTSDVLPSGGKPAVKASIPLTLK